VILAVEGEQAINLAMFAKPDLILMNLSLPIIVLTAHAMKDDHQRAIDAGCDETMMTLSWLTFRVWFLKLNRI
jgi:CheY-like chemotaxis protein